MIRRILFSLVAFAFVGAAHGHQAPSGWNYPLDCCASTDCHPVSCAALREVDGGIEFLGIRFTGEMIKRSEDGYCHVCVGHYGPAPDQSRPHCVFMTPRT